MTHLTTKLSFFSRRQWLIIGGTVVGVAVVVTTILLLLTRGTQHPSLIELEASYTMTGDTQVVEPTKAFSFPVSYDDSALIDIHDNFKSFDDIITVYRDPLLQSPASDAYVTYDRKAHALVVKASPVDIDTITNKAGERISVAPDGKWGAYQTYYIAEKRDSTTGEALTAPRVTSFTVTDAPAAPTVSAQVDDRGLVNFSWNAVANASKYYIVSLPYNRDPEYVSETTKTEWSSGESDPYVSLNSHTNNTQNGNLFGCRWTVDNVAGGMVDKNEMECRYPDFAVIPVLGESLGTYGVVPGEIVSQLPLKIAFQTLKKQGVSGVFRSADVLPSELPVVMTDNTITSRRVSFDTNSISEGRSPSDGSPLTYVTLTVPGSLLGTTAQVTGHQAAAVKEKAESLNAGLATAAHASGTRTPRYYSDASAEATGSVSKKAPRVRSTLTGTNDLSIYIAANLVAGKTTIDVSKASEKTPGIEVLDAAQEAVEQNPLALGVESVTYNPSSQMLIVDYTIDDASARGKLQRDVLKKTHDVIKDVVNGDLSSTDTMNALAQYVHDTASFDSAAITSSPSGTNVSVEDSSAWTAEGVLLRGKGVSSSYAQALHILAREAGLESFIISGAAYGQPVAWNMVRDDNKWENYDTARADVEGTDARVSSDTLFSYTTSTNRSPLADLYIRSLWK